MRYQYKREPLTGDEATLANACNPHEEKLVVWVGRRSVGAGLVGRGLLF